MQLILNIGLVIDSLSFSSFLNAMPEKSYQIIVNWSAAWLLVLLVPRSMSVSVSGKALTKTEAKTDCSVAKSSIADLFIFWLINGALCSELSSS